MNRNSTDLTSTKTLQPMHWVLIVCGMIVLLTAAVLYNQHQQRQTDLKLAQLAATQSQASHSSSSTTIEPSSADLDMGEDGISMSTDATEAEPSASMGNANLKILACRSMANTTTSNLEFQSVHFGLKPMQSASADLKTSCLKLIRCCEPT